MGDDGTEPDAVSAVRWRRRHHAVGCPATLHITGLISRHPGGAPGPATPGCPTLPQELPICPTAPGRIGLMAPASRCPRDAGAAQCSCRGPSAVNETAMVGAAPAGPAAQRTDRH